MEGARQVVELARHQVLELLLVCSENFSSSRTLLQQAQKCVRLSEKLFSALSDLESPQGVMGFFSKPDWTWSDITSHVLYLDRLQDPGNLGTLLRTAAGTGLFSIITAPGTVSCFKNKVVRSSAGYLFSVPFLEHLPLSALPERNYRLFAAHPRKGRSLFEVSFEPPLALIVGSESQGADLSQIKAPVEFVHIPMAGTTDSLNAAVSGSILMYEVVRTQLL